MVNFLAYVNIGVENVEIFSENMHIRFSNQIVICQAAKFSFLLFTLLTAETQFVRQFCSDVHNIKERQTKKNANKGSNFSKERDSVVGPILFFEIELIFKEEYLPKTIIQ